MNKQFAKYNSSPIDSMQSKRQKIIMRNPNEDDLIKGPSKAAFQQNVATEIKAGKPRAQALAIAYSQKKHADILPTPKYKDTLQSYGLSSLKNNNGAVTSPQQARQIAAQRSGQSYNQQTAKAQNYDRYGMRGK